MGILMYRMHGEDSWHVGLLAAAARGIRRIHREASCSQRDL